MGKTREIPEDDRIETRGTNRKHSTFMNCAQIPASNCDLDSRMGWVAGIPASDCELGSRSEVAECLGFLVLGHWTLQYRRLLLDLGQSGAMVEAKLILVEVQRTFEELHLEYKPYPGAIAALNKLATNGAKMVIISNSSRRASVTMDKMKALGFRHISLWP
ncbi:unnamed protein product [Linum trigynum]|uniref:Haloacid dehalogenase-like hydrolase (HAD) superfamily protein n=1 Tax=Linum trigynum TaxID=586398 RepID=A0AAV2G542_9ROSI